MCFHPFVVRTYGDRDFLQHPLGLARVRIYQPLPLCVHWMLLTQRKAAVEQFICMKYEAFNVYPVGTVVSSR